MGRKPSDFLIRQPIRFGSLIKTLIRRRLLLRRNSNRSAADELGISTRAYRMIVNGKRKRLHRSTVARLHDLLLEAWRDRVTGTFEQTGRFCRLPLSPEEINDALAYCERLKAFGGDSLRKDLEAMVTVSELLIDPQQTSDP